MEPTSPETAQSTGRSKIPGFIGAWAEIFIVALLLFAVIGVVWGATRPSLTGEVMEGGTLSITDPNQLNANVEFSTFGTMVICFAVLGVVLGLYAALKLRAYNSVWTMLWSMFSAGCGALVFYSLGTMVAMKIVGEPDLSNVTVGSTITYLPPVHPNLAFLVPLYVCMFVYWTAAVFEGEGRGSRSGEISQSQETTHANVNI